MTRALIIFSIVLHKQLVNAIGLKLPGSEWSLPGLGFPRRGYILLREYIKQNLEGGLKMDSGPGPNQLLSHWLSAMTALIAVADCYN